MDEDSWLTVFDLTDNTGDGRENNKRFSFRARKVERT